MSMFAAAGPTGAAAPHPLPDLPELPSAELLRMEKELLGFYITSHPLMEHQAVLERYVTATTREARTAQEGSEMTVGGMITRVRRAMTKTGRSAGQPMAMITLEDLEGQIDGVLFSDVLAEANKKSPGAVAAESIVFLRGKVDRRRETPCIVVQDVIPWDAALPRLTRSLLLSLDRARHTPQDVARLRDALAQYRGNIPVYVRANLNGSGTVVVKLHNDLSVKASAELERILCTLLGADAVRWCGDGTRRRAQQQALFAAAEKEETPESAMPAPAMAEESA
jgi:DNA polymerase III subunit alpha